MIRRALLLTITCLALTLTAAAQIDKPVWLAWLLNPASGHAWLVSDDGTVLHEALDIPTSGSDIGFFPRLPSDMNDFPDIAVSNAGRYFAYSRDNQLVVRDTISGEEILTYGPLNTFDNFTYSWVRRFFNEDDTRMAFGINRSDYRAGEGGWELVVFDLTRGEVTHTLRHTDPEAQAVDPPRFDFVPIVRLFSGAEVSFFLWPDGIESGPSYNGWTWNIETGVITPNRAFTTHSSDYLPSTGEVIFPAEDSRLEMFPCEGDCPQFIHLNTLQVYDPAIGMSFPFFHSPTVNFWQEHFVEGGEKILAQTFGIGFNEVFVWYLVGRDGKLLADLTHLNIASVASIPEGMIYTHDGSPDLMRLDTRDTSQEASVIWTAPDGSTPLIIWASEPALETGFTPWAQLAPPA